MDAQKGTYFSVDKNGDADPNSVSSEGEALRASYDSENDELYLEAGRYSASDGISLYFGEDGNTNVLYYYDYLYDDEEYQAYTRGKAPAAP